LEVILDEQALHDPARQRLLSGALEIFAEKGFREATVREICAKAEVNAASVNYYFRSKESLYVEVLEFAYREASERYPDDQARDASLPVEERLFYFVQNFLQRLLDDTHLGHHGKLFAREIADPTKALDKVLETSAKPRCELIHNIIGVVLGTDITDMDRHRIALSIVGQCLMFRHSRSLIDLICPEIIADKDEIDRTARLITDFSMAGLRGMNVENNGRKG
jgi:AcrR family transcriptional regulator